MLLVLFQVVKTSAQQDVWLQSFSLPVSECGASNSEIVQVSILNNSTTPMLSNTITAFYTIDSGPITSQTIGAILMGNASINFAFNTNANLSACGSHIIKVWVSRPNDPNQNNDTLQWTIQNNCQVVPGDIQTSVSVCASSNSGALNLVGWANGTITQWQSSTNGGTIWSDIANTTTTLNYNNVGQNTIYRVQIDGGLCPDANSDTAQITVVAPPIPGTLNGATSVCLSNASGVLSLIGTSSPVSSWESSTNGGTSWSTIPNTSSSYSYSNLTQNTTYRVLLDGGFCPDIYSPSALITVDASTGPGSLSGSANLCASSANGSINITGPIGSVLNWEFSSNSGSTWTPIASTSVTYSYSGLTQTTWYRAYTQGTVCPAVYSDTAIISVQAVPSVPSILGTDSLCITNANGTLSIPGGNTILDWESSSASAGPYNSLSSNVSALSFSGLTNTQYYRVLLEGTDCPDFYSQIGVVYIEQLTEPGNMSDNDTLCITNASGSLSVTGNIGTIEYWQYSENNGASWQTIANNASSYNFTDLLVPTMFRVFTDGGFCPSYFSDTTEIMIADSIDVGNISGDALFCAQGSGTIEITGSQGTIGNWVFSANNGVTWNTIPSNSATYNYANVTQTTWYRAFFNGGVCPDKFSDTVVITIDPASNAGDALPNISICEGVDTSFSLLNYVGSIISWESSADGLIWNAMVGESNDTLNLAAPLSTQFYRAIISSGICAADTTNQAIVTINPNPVITLSPNVTIIEGDTTSLLGVGGDSGLWSPNLNINDVTLNNPIVYPIETTFYVYSVVGSNGCTNTDSILVTVLPPTFFDIKNVVTRNEDGFNDVWYIEGIENYPNTEVHIYNIYGNEVFSSPAYANEWDGTLNGKKLPNGTYYYVVILSETGEQIKGTILLLGDE